MRERYLLLYSHEREPVTEVLLKALPRERTLFLSLKELLSSVEIFDEIREGRAELEWRLSDGTLVRRDDRLLINRVLTVPEELFADYEEEDRSYAAAEYRAYLLFALSAFSKVTEKPGSHGLSGNRYSLPQQWQRVSDRLPQLSTPSYEIGLLSDRILREPQAVFSSIYNFYLWRPDLSREKPASFAFLRPKGRPVLGSFFGGEAIASSYGEGGELDPSRCKRLESLVKELQSLFGYWIGETLLFDDGEKVSFGMISNLPYASRRLNGFSDLVLNAVDRYGHFSEKRLESLCA